MQFTKEAWSGIADGSITVTFRTWARARVVAGRTYRVPPGVIAVEAVSPVNAGDITPEDAAAAGSDLASLRARLGVADDREVWRVDFRYTGEDPRDALRAAAPSGDELDAIVAALDTMDRRSKSGPWTRATLRSISESPGVRAPDLAPLLDVDTAHFKRRVRRLKELGLTESLRTGYRLSVRGEAVWGRVGGAT